MRCLGVFFLLFFNIKNRQRPKRHGGILQKAWQHDSLCVGLLCCCFLCGANDTPGGFDAYYLKRSSCTRLIPTGNLSDLFRGKWSAVYNASLPNTQHLGDYANYIIAYTRDISPPPEILVIVERCDVEPSEI